MSYTGCYSDGAVGGAYYPDGVYLSPALPGQLLVWFQGVPWLIDNQAGAWARRVRFRGFLEALLDCEPAQPGRDVESVGLPAKVLEGVMRAY